MPKMRPALLRTVGGVVSALAASCAQAQFFETKYELYGSKVPGTAICGMRQCDAGSANGILFPLNKKPYPPDATNESTPASVAASVIGYVTRDAYGGTPGYCSVSGGNPFRPEHIGPKGNASGKAVASEYTRTVKTTIDAKASAQADLEAIIALGLPNSVSISALQAKLETAYNTVNASQFKLKATYYEFGLKDKVYQDLARQSEWSDCLSLLRKNPSHKLIVAAGLIAYSADYTAGTVADNFSSITTELDQYKIKYNVEASVRRKVDENIKAIISDSYRIIAWRLVDAAKFP